MLPKRIGQRPTIWCSVKNPPYRMPRGSQITGHVEGLRHFPSFGASDNKHLFVVVPLKVSYLSSVRGVSPTIHFPVFFTQQVCLRQEPASDARSLSTSTRRLRTEREQSGAVSCCPFVICFGLWRWLSVRQKTGARVRAATGRPGFRETPRFVARRRDHQASNIFRSFEQSVADPPSSLRSVPPHRPPHRRCPCPSESRRRL